ncbi:MAG: penicillin-insensitive murein endopeptidase [Kofleriaceae bacterium]|nr:penicillin-insensitive murein endopeptidase [Kofleriaceae bacterium]
MRQSILLALLLGLIPLATGACRHRNVGGTTQAASTTEVDLGADSEAVVLADDVDPTIAKEPHSETVDLALVAGDLPTAAVDRAPHPLEGMSNAEVEKLLLNHPEKIGAVSLGRPNRGALYGGVNMPKGPGWKVVNTSETFGTQETVDFLAHTISRVNELFPDTPVIRIGDISRNTGGHLRPHVSHQSGRDVDIGFYYNDASKWYATANERNLDMPRTWAFIKITVTDTDIAAIFIDRRLQSLLRTYAESIGENANWLDAVFGGPTSKLRPVLLHEPGHKTHMHLRYFNPIAQETGRRVYRALLKHKKIKPPTYYVNYKVKRGDTLNKIARKMKTTVKIIKKTNRIRGNRIYANRTYKIPKKGGVSVPQKLVLPVRRLPALYTQTAPQSPASAGTASTSK